jgi:hypothetical protein
MVVNRGESKRESRHKTDGESQRVIGWTAVENAKEKESRRQKENIKEIIGDNRIGNKE